LFTLKNFKDRAAEQYKIKIIINNSKTKEEGKTVRMERVTNQEKSLLNSGTSLLVPQKKF
jgi:hypothetical protein